VLIYVYRFVYAGCDYVSICHIHILKLVSYHCMSCWHAYMQAFWSQNFNLLWKFRRTNNIWWRVVYDEILAYYNIICILTRKRKFHKIILCISAHSTLAKYELY